MQFGSIPGGAPASKSRATMTKSHFGGACLVGVLLVPLFAANTQKTTGQQPEPIRVSVTRVNVGVIVSTAGGNFVDGLRRQDFHVFDNGVETTPTDFEPVDDPANVLLLIEAGPAVYLLEGGHLSAAYTLLAGLSTDDQVAVVRYDEAPKAICAFTADKKLAADALERLNF